MATTLKFENKGKPTPPFWKGLGKVLVWAMPIVSTTIVVLPIPSLLIKSLIVLGTNLLLALGKELTTMTFNPEQVPLTYNPNMEQTVLLKAEQKVQVEEAKETVKEADKK
jgi:hypothetical protein